MRVLAIDTSSTRGSVALVAEGQLCAFEALDSGRYSTELMPSIGRVLSASGRSLASLDALAVAIGPGAFTGLRVGIGTAQGLALGLGRPCVGVDTFEAWVEPRRRELRLAVTLDALRGGVLVKLYESGVAAAGPRHLAPEVLAAEVPPDTLFVGGGAREYRERIVSQARSPRFDDCEGHLAPAVAVVAVRQLRSGATGLARDLRPAYLREAYVRQP